MPDNTTARGPWGFCNPTTRPSTLGLGDITCESELGRVFSSIVLLTGIVLLLIMLQEAARRRHGQICPLVISR